MVKKEQFGDRLRKLRKNKRVSQDDFGHAVGLRGRQISRIENNESLPRIENVQKIADYFGISISYLFGDSQQVARKIENVEPTYDGWRVWIETMAPIDLTLDERISLGQIRFAGDPEPWRYSAILDQIRGPLGRDQGDAQGSSVRALKKKKD